MIKTYYYAIDKDGQGWYYDNPPIFDGESWNVDSTYDCLECMGAVNDLHPANLFSFPIPEDMTYEDEPTYKPSITLEWPGILELAETEDELLDYLEDVSEFTRNEKGNN